MRGVEIVELYFSVPKCGSKTILSQYHQEDFETQGSNYWKGLRMRFSRKEKSIETVIYKFFPHHPKSYTTSPLKKICLLISIVSWIKPGPKTLPDLTNKHSGEGLPFKAHISFMPFFFQDRFTGLPLLS